MDQTTSDGVAQAASTGIGGAIALVAASWFRKFIDKADARDAITKADIARLEITMQEATSAIEDMRRDHADMAKTLEYLKGHLDK